MDAIDWEERLKRLLLVTGKPGKCKGCGVAIYWCLTRSATSIPYTLEGIPHFTDCPKADQFRKKKGKANA